MLSFHTDSLEDDDWQHPDMLSLIMLMEADVSLMPLSLLRAVARGLRRRVIHSSLLCQPTPALAPLRMRGDPSAVFVRCARTAKVFPVLPTRPLLFSSAANADVNLSLLEAVEPGRALLSFNAETGSYVVENQSSRPDSLFVNHVDCPSGSRTPLTRSAMLEVGGLRFLFHMPAALSARQMGDTEGGTD